MKIGRNTLCPCGSGKKYKKCCLVNDLKEREPIFRAMKNPIVKASGTTSSEKYLGYLCEKTFLSLWSNLCVYKGKGEELCDLLVVFGNDILVFSDKNCKFKESTNGDELGLNWSRWFKRAIVKSAYQIWRAERWIKQRPQLFLDRKCTVPLPIDMPEVGKEKFHLIVVAHGVSKHVKKFFGASGTGSLMINSSLKGINKHIEPFYIGDLCPEKTFIHILDDDSLNTLMNTRDTVSDFLAYLEKRELLLRGRKKIIATGEEELLSIYLKNINEKKEHDFIFPKDNEKVDGVALLEGGWEEFQKNPQRLAQIKEDRISYLWDSLIETFNKYALEGSQYYVSSGGVKDTEKVLRFMAGEPRFLRRYLAKNLMDMMKTTPKNQRRLRVLPPFSAERPYYVFLLFPLPKNPSISNDEYRMVRRRFLTECCLVARLKYKDAKDIVGIATESGTDNMGRSEDACYFDARNWDEKMEKSAKKSQKELGILQNPNYELTHIREYPDVN